MTELVPVVTGTVVTPPGPSVRDVDPSRWNDPNHRDLAVEIWLRSKQSQHTRDAYRRDIGTWFGWCDHRAVPAEDARRADVDEWRDALAGAGASHATIARQLAAVSSFYRYWLSESIVSRNPAQETARPKVSAEPVSIRLTRPQSAALLAYVNSMDDQRAGVIVRLLAETGMRVGELCGVRVTDLGISGEHYILTVTRKGGKNQVLPVALGTRGRIMAYLDGRRDGWLLQVRRTERRKGDGQMDRSYVRQILRRVSREAGLPEEVYEHMHPHVLRHSAATILAEDGVPVHEIQKLLGHADLRTTQRYIHHAQSLDASPVYRLAALIAD